VKSRRHLDRQIKRHVARSYSIAKSGIGSWRSERILSLVKSRNDHSRPSHRTGGSRLFRRHFGVRGFKLSKKLDIATREIPIREIPIRSQPSNLAGHVADIEATIGIRGFSLTEVWSIAIRDIPRTHQDRPSILDAWRKSGDSEKFRKETRHRHIGVREIAILENKRSGFFSTKSPTQSEPSIFQGHVAEIEAFGKNPDKRVHRLFGIRHFADLGDKRSGTLNIAKSRREIPTVRLLGHVAAINDIGKSPETKHTIGESAIAKSRRQRTSTSKIAKSRFAISRYDLDRPIINRSGPLKSQKGKFFAFRHFERKRTGKARNALTFTRVVTCEGDQRPNSSPISSYRLSTHQPSANRQFLRLEVNTNFSL
jgi:hypothetical protein